MIMITGPSWAKRIRPIVKHCSQHSQLEPIIDARACLLLCPLDFTTSAPEVDLFELDDPRLLANTIGEHHLRLFVASDIQISVLLCSASMEEFGVKIPPSPHCCASTFLVLPTGTSAFAIPTVIACESGCEFGLCY